MFWLPGSGFNGFDGPEIVKKNIHEANKKIIKQHSLVALVTLAHTMM